MKKHIIILISVICLNCLSYGQTNVYHPFPDSSAMWTVSCGGFEAIFCNTNNYYYTGDTIINRLSYHKLGGQGNFGVVDNIGNCIVKGFDNLSYQGGIRNDTNRQVWFFPADSSKEQLLYTFNLKVNDTLPNLYSGNYHSSSVTVKSIDSLLTGKTYRKRFNLYSINAPFNPMIEGIGSTTGLLENFIRPFEAGCGLQCFEQNGKGLYPNSPYPCDTIRPTSVREKQNPNNAINVFPNPATTAVTIKTSQNGNCTVVLQDMLGQIVLYQKNVGQENVMDVSSLAKGIYVVSMQDWTGQVIGRQKLIVQ